MGENMLEVSTTAKTFFMVNVSPPLSMNDLTKWADLYQSFFKPALASFSCPEK